MRTRIGRPLSLSERLAQYIAWLVAKKQSWGTNPELWRMDMYRLEYNESYATYLVYFKLDWGTYRVVVTLCGAEGKPFAAHVFMVHPSVTDFFWYTTCEIGKDPLTDNWDQAVVMIDREINSHKMDQATFKLTGLIVHEGSFIDLQAPYLKRSEME